MKLLMENWRTYLSEAQTSDIYGSLYLFEGDEVSKTSFYEAINMLSESDDDTDKFLENWERSVEYMLENIKLNEQSSGSVLDRAIINAGGQAYLAIQKLGGKAFAPVLNVMKKLKSYEEKNPKTAKALGFVLKGLAVAVASAGLSTALAGGGGTEEIQAVADALASVAPDVADSVAQVAKADGTEAVEIAKQVISDQGQELSQVSDTLSQANDPGLQQIGDAAGNTEEVYSSFADMMDAEYERSDLERKFSYRDMPGFDPSPEEQKRAVELGIISPEELEKSLEMKDKPYQPQASFEDQLDASIEKQKSAEEEEYFQTLKSKYGKASPTPKSRLK